LRDSFRQTSNAFSSSILGSTTASGTAQGPNESVIAPLASLLRNSGTVGITYQFAANTEVGANGVFSNLYYPNPTQVPDLSDSSSKGGSAFYTRRFSQKHYLGVTYQYQKILTSATQGEGQSETQTHSLLFFYTLYLQPTLSVSFFGGPEHVDTTQSGLLPFQKWTPSTGVSLSWRGQHSSLAATYLRTISDGGGLGGAVQLNSALASLRHQFTRSLGGSLGANYSLNQVQGQSISSNTGGHTISGNVALERSLGQHFNLGIGYLRLHQSYDNIPGISNAPNRNQVSVSVSYQFQRPLGR
jgi:hypothetical protein